MRRRAPALTALLFLAAAGCGTVMNLHAPPEPTSNYRGMGPTACEPLGGVNRAAVMGGLTFASGLESLNQGPGEGRMLTGIGLLGAGTVILAVDTPLSLVGDMLTLPVVNARRNHEPWASWWGPNAANDPLGIRTEGAPPGAASPARAPATGAPPAPPTVSNVAPRPTAGAVPPPPAWTPGQTAPRGSVQ